ncbi:hypothetical protein DSECCO2_596190 [anaerobic digester metagenome]
MPEQPGLSGRPGEVKNSLKCVLNSISIQRLSGKRITIIRDFPASSDAIADFSLRNPENSRNYSERGVTDRLIYRKVAPIAPEGLYVPVGSDPLMA